MYILLLKKTLILIADSQVDISLQCGTTFCYVFSVQNPGWISTKSDSVQVSHVFHRVLLINVTLQVIPSLIFLFNTDTSTNMALVRNSEAD